MNVLFETCPFCGKSVRGYRHSPPDSTCGICNEIKSDEDHWHFYCGIHHEFIRTVDGRLLCRKDR